MNAWRFVALAAVAAEITVAVAGCEHPRLGGTGPPLTVCGTVLDSGAGVGARGMTLRLAVPGRPVAHAPERSLLPPPEIRSPSGAGPFPSPEAYNLPLVVIIGQDCAQAPVVTVQPANAARTAAVARAANGGIAGMTLITLRVTITISAYLGHRLVGRLTLPRGLPPPGSG